MKSKTLLTIVATIFLALSPGGYINNYAHAQQTESVNSENSDSIKYTKIREITNKILGIETIKIEYGLDSKVWQSLKSGITRQEFYNSIKQAPIEFKVTTIFKGITGIRGCINSDDLKGAFFSEADRFIKNKPSQYDPGLIFSIEDKAILKKILDRELKSNLIGTIKPWNPFAPAKEVYLYPPKSQILLRTDRKGDSSFEIYINTNKPTDVIPSYKISAIIKIRDEKEKSVFTKFLLHSILESNFYTEYLLK